ncbi:DNA-binding protein EMBP-1 isoform X2 [Brachypodium distachyon]|uniref:BZIP domain-containing protein n=1 Tax=Brachypodium distachyon TaxID=15368 RepID=A0A0Q3NS87_BRADI|nr:DNA-binding protein EMBP-1 isoform X2 [Brachypodium distachyon]KQK20382.1 hypothetical protein BRADI_1g54180v3 [Brachypodium distachyon]|eukprot:XP_010228232.1 DNA-binding protein EMBP-1 isoform X2 [Brachypodium distachyon]
MASSSDEQPKPPEPPAAAVATAVPPQTHAEWAASVQAFYAAAGHPYAAWPAQHLMAAAASGAPYGAPVPFPMYHPGAAMAYYAQASMAAGVPYPTAEAVAAAPAVAEGKGKGKGGGVSPEKGSSAAPSGDDGSRSCDSGSDDSSDTRDYDTDHKDSSAAKKRKSGNTSAEGEPSQTAVVTYAAESPYQLKARSASKLPVSAPGRAALPNATPNLNIGIDLWSASQPVAVLPGQGEASPGLALARCDGVGQLDEREIKRERRKQSNRESARRSRLRKQQECEELSRKVAELTTENNALRTELDQLKKACEDMEAQNTRLMEPAAVTTTLGMSIEAPKVKQHEDEGKLHKKSNNNSNGKYVGGSRKPEANSR